MAQAVGAHGSSSSMIAGLKFCVVAPEFVHRYTLCAQPLRYLRRLLSHYQL
jgi:hypothetical protein